MQYTAMYSHVIVEGGNAGLTAAVELILLAAEDNTAAPEVLNVAPQS